MMMRIEMMIERKGIEYVKSEEKRRKRYQSDYSQGINSDISSILLTKEKLTKQQNRNQNAFIEMNSSISFHQTFPNPNISMFSNFIPRTKLNEELKQNQAMNRNT